MEKSKIFNTKIYLVGLLILTANLTLPSLIKEPVFGIRINTTNSLPYTLFISTKMDEPERGKFVAFMHPSSNIHISKQIVGLPGDHITLEGQQLCINHFPLGPIQKETNDGVALIPIQEGQIPEGHVFVYGSHPYSFDSRYGEIGLIALLDIHERLWPIF